MSRNFALRGTRVAGMFAIRAESPNSLEDSRDRAVVTVDYRRYHQITGVGRNEIVRRHVGARRARKKKEKKVTTAGYGRRRRSGRRGGGAE